VDTTELSQVGMEQVTADVGVSLVVGTSEELEVDLIPNKVAEL